MSEGVLIVLEVEMIFSELAWGAFLFWVETRDYCVKSGDKSSDKAYMHLFSNQPFLEKLREDPNSVPCEEFSNNVLTFLRKWGGRHIGKENCAAEQIFQGLTSLHERFQALRDKSILDVNWKQSGELISETFETLRGISWTDRSYRNVKLGETFASKLAHVMNPSLFVIWDNAISAYAKEKGKQNYSDFLRWMQEEAQEVTSTFQELQMGQDPAAFLSQKLGYNPPKTLAKFLDEYNVFRGHNGLDGLTPPQWLLKLKVEGVSTESTA